MPPARLPESHSSDRYVSRSGAPLRWPAIDAEGSTTVVGLGEEDRTVRPTAAEALANVLTVLDGYATRTAAAHARA